MYDGLEAVYHDGGSTATGGEPAGQQMEFLTRVVYKCIRTDKHQYLFGHTPESCSGQEKRGGQSDS